MNIKHEAEIRFKIKLTKPPVEGKIIEITMDIEDLEEGSISDEIMERNLYPSMGWPTDYYRVLEREITIKNS